MESVRIGGGGGGGAALQARLAGETLISAVGKDVRGSLADASGRRTREREHN